jgi:sugar/nucleoside kinase (ribokinase family)
MPAFGRDVNRMAPTAAAARRAHARRRPQLPAVVIEDPKGYRVRLERVLRGSDLVKVSEEDLAWLDPARPRGRAARALLQRGPAVVLLTRGPHGATVLTARGDTQIALVAAACFASLVAAARSRAPARRHRSSRRPRRKAPR